MQKRCNGAKRNGIFSAYLPTHIKSLWDFLAHNSGTILNINHLARTRNIASLPCKIVLGDSLFVLGRGLCPDISQIFSIFVHENEKPSCKRTAYES